MTCLKILMIFLDLGHFVISRWSNPPRTYSGPGPRESNSVVSAANFNIICDERRFMPFAIFDGHEDEHFGPKREDHHPNREDHVNLSPTRPSIHFDDPQSGSTTSYLLVFRVRKCLNTHPILPHLCQPTARNPQPKFLFQYSTFHMPSVNTLNSHHRLTFFFPPFFLTEL